MIILHPPKDVFRRVFERSKYCCHIFHAPKYSDIANADIWRWRHFWRGRLNIRNQITWQGRRWNLFPAKKVPIVQLSNGWKWQSQGLKGRTARKGWKSSCRSCQRRAANLTQKLKHIWEPIMKEAQQKAFILCLRVKRARNRNFDHSFRKLTIIKWHCMGGNLENAMCIFLKYGNQVKGVRM